MKAPPDWGGRSIVPAERVSQRGIGHVAEGVLGECPANFARRAARVAGVGEAEVVAAFSISDRGVEFAQARIEGLRDGSDRG